MYRIAGIDVHKKKLAVVVADVEVHGEYHFERCWFAANPEQLRDVAWRRQWRDKLGLGFMLVPQKSTPKSTTK